MSNEQVSNEQVSNEQVSNEQVSNEQVSNERKHTLADDNFLRIMQCDSIEDLMYGTDPYIRWYGKLFSPKSHIHENYVTEDVYDNGTLRV